MFLQQIISTTAHNFMPRSVAGAQRIIVVDHPLIEHKLGLAREKSTCTKDFNALISEITKFEIYEATRDLELEEVAIETPISNAVVRRLSGKKLTLVPILRAGDVMMVAARDVVPSAKIGYIGMYRDENTSKPQQYFHKLPKDCDQRTAFIMDPMLATGGSAVLAVDILKEAGCEDIRMMNIVCAPEGLAVMAEHHPEVPIYTCAIDDHLNEDNYIVPGLGDAGDRLFGTK